MEKKIMDKMPNTDSVRQLAAFWDSHDVTDFENEFEEVRKPVFKESLSVSVPLDTGEFQSIEKIARTKGVSDAELLHEWIRERLRAA